MTKCDRLISRLGTGPGNLYFLIMFVHLWWMTHLSRNYRPFCFISRSVAVIILLAVAFFILPRLRFLFFLFLLISFICVPKSGICTCRDRAVLMILIVSSHRNISYFTANLFSVFFFVLASRQRFGQENDGCLLIITINCFWEIPASVSG